MDRHDAEQEHFPKFLTTFTNSQHLIVTLPVHNMNITEQTVFDVADPNSMQDACHI